MPVCLASEPTEATMNKDNLPTEPSQLPKASRSGCHPLFGALEGVMSIQPGVDLTEPADPDWGKVYEKLDRR
jgi:hypothetical protein